MQAIIGFLVVVLLALAGYWLWDMQTTAPNTPRAPGIPNATTTVATTTRETYASSTLGISFTYPSNYLLQERDLPGSAQRRHHVITLMPRSDVPPPQGGEGPPTITVDVIQNNLDKLTTDAWIRNSSASNFKLSPDSVIATTTLGGVPARTYQWDGLYQGTTVALARAAYIYAFSVTSLNPTDPIRSDFEQVLRSVILQ